MVDGSASENNIPSQDPGWGMPPKLVDGWGRPLNESISSNERLLKPYLVRPLTPEENSKIQQAATDPKQFELTRTLLSKDEFKPTNLLTIGKKEFLVGKVIGGTYDGQFTPGFLVMFYENPATEILMPRLINASLSDRSWRSTPAVYGSYSKGTGIHYTQETKAHKNISRYIEQSIANGNIANHPSGKAIDDQFTPGRRGETHAGWYTFDKEIAKYDDKGILKQFQKYRPGHLSSSEVGKDVDLSAEFKNFDFSSRELKAFFPNFGNPPVETDRLAHAFMGEIKLETYTAKLNGRPIEWVMAYDKEGRVWIERIAFLDKEVNSYGVMPEVIDSGCLTSKPFEYPKQASALKEGGEIINDKAVGYADITPLLNNLLPIQQFRKARGIVGK